MKVEKYDGQAERRVLVALVTDPIVLARVASRWTGGMFESDWSNLVGDWCVEYHREHGEAPHGDLQSVFEEWASTTSRPRETVSAIETFLSRLSDGAEELSTEYLITLAGQHFNSVAMAKMADRVQRFVKTGRIEEANEEIAVHRRIELGTGSFASPVDDFSVWSQAFDHSDAKPLVKYPGAVGEYLADAFKRGEFYSFMGPDKTAKTTNLVDLAWRALKQRRRVLFIDAGDSSLEEVLVRFACRMSFRPDVDAEVLMPTSYDAEGVPEFVREHKVAIDAATAYQIMKKKVAAGALRIENAPNSTLTVQDIKSKLDDWALDGWLPDIVIVDYADILAPPIGIVDKLDKIDAVWRALRSLSQQTGCLIVTATQSDSAAYGKAQNALLSRENFSGRKTKLAEVNGMIGINVSEAERETHSARWNWVVRRKMRNRGRARCVYLTGCYDCENPIIISRF